MASKSVDSLDLLSVEDLRRRIKDISAGEEHLRRVLKPDNPHNQVLRVRDVARYIGTTGELLRVYCPGVGIQFAGRWGERRKFEQAKMPAKIQRGLSQFFHGWDHGHLVKAKVGEEWKIINRHSGHTSLATLDAAPTPSPDARVHTLRIDMTTLGPRLRSK